MIYVIIYIIMLIISNICSVFIVASEEQLDPDHYNNASGVATILIINIIPVVNIVVNIIGLIVYRNECINICKNMFGIK